MGFQMVDEVTNFQAHSTWPGGRAAQGCLSILAVVPSGLGGLESYRTSENDIIKKVKCHGMLSFLCLKHLT